MARDGIKVLVVEDDEGDFILLERLFREIDWARFKVDWTPSFDAALPRMADNLDDVYLVDYRLGVHTGIDLLLQAEALGCTSPVIVLTGQGHYEADVQAMKAGAADYLVKGQIRPALLERSIRYAIERKRILKALQKSENEARQHREELAHVARLNTLGELATGLAHELNQPLTAVVNYVRGCQRRLKNEGIGSGELSEALERAGSEARRAGAILHRIRGMVCKRRPDRVRADLNDLVTDATGILKSELRRAQVELELCLSDGLPSLWIDLVQVEQVLVNLMKNAIEAMEGACSSPRRLRVSTQLESRMVEILVQDSGPGVEEEDIQRVFDAFFTTKEKGMGMGLSICQSIVESQGGRLSVRRNGWGGCTFQFTLPWDRSEPTTEETRDDARSRG